MVCGFLKNPWVTGLTSQKFSFLFFFHNKCRIFYIDHWWDTYQCRYQYSPKTFVFRYDGTTLTHFGFACLGRLDATETFLEIHHPLGIIQMLQCDIYQWNLLTHQSVIESCCSVVNHPKALQHHLLCPQYDNLSYCVIRNLFNFSYLSAFSSLYSYRLVLLDFH